MLAHDQTLLLALQDSAPSDPPYWGWHQDLAAAISSSRCFGMLQGVDLSHRTQALYRKIIKNNIIIISIECIFYDMGPHQFNRS